ncbi:Serine/threonine-protein kinase D2 [Takifugu flavidus]|uniref:Serine/threonine-protein kinase D2 n=1 Tax=Takifugu flavidus TaxID=433684 RepID=A0A5C6PBP1_9TELE|nr:Serine/threonine-protein kinase D2 [Takifugu flavidus]
MTQVFFPPGGSSPPVSSVMQQGTPIPVAPMPVQGTFPAMDLSSGQGPGGVVMPSLPPTPAGVSFIIQIGLTRESVLMPLTADLAYVKQIACSIVDTKRGCESRLGTPPPPPSHLPSQKGPNIIFLFNFDLIPLTLIGKTAPSSTSCPAPPSLPTIASLLPLPANGAPASFSFRHQFIPTFPQ